MNRKPRILLVGEASFHATGYSNYGYEVQKRLHASGKYELAELACYGSPKDPRQAELPWQYFGNLPEEGQQVEREEYDSKLTNQFGEWRFNDVCLTFQPDIVWDIRDGWMMEFAERSPFRQFYRWCIMPTVDAIPQNEQWLATYINADSVLTYSDWGLRTLEVEGGGLINTVGSAPPGVDINTFVPMDKAALRKSFSVDEDIYIVGTVMRNQPRKLYPDLMAAFAEFLRAAPTEIAKKTYLYLHTSYPDQGWDIPRLIKQTGLSHRVLMTYKCRSCSAVFPAFFQDACGACHQCGANTALPPNVKVGVDRRMLARIINLFDVYVQYANCLVPGTKVLSKQGWTNAEEIIPGDEVWTHKGRWRKVRNTFCHNTTNNVLTIDLHADYVTLDATNEHPVWCLSDNDHNNNRSFREQLGNKIRNGKDIPSLSFKELKYIRPGDMIGFPIDDEVEDIEHICDFSVTLSFCRFIGLFVADGSWNRKFRQVSVTCHAEQDRCINLAIAETGGKIYPYKGRNAVDVKVCGSRWHEPFSKWFLKHEHKRLPPWVMHLPLDKQREILIGMFMGDGHYLASEKTSIYVTISETLADQLKSLLRRQRISYNVRVVVKGGNRRHQYRFEVPGDIANGEFVSQRRSTRNLYVGNYHLLQVKSIEPITYSGKVYNFEVEEDNSYTVKIGALHNSEGFGIPMVEAAACGVPVFATDYSAMSDVVRKLEGYPIKVANLRMDSEFGCYRATPDANDFIKSLIRFFNQGETARRQASFQARRGVEKHYTWDKAASKWMSVFDSSLPQTSVLAWDSPVRIHVPQQPTKKEFPSNEAFVEWAICHILGRPEMTKSYMALRLIRDLSWRIAPDNAGTTYQNENSMLGNRTHLRDFNEQDVINELTKMCEINNIWEDKRCQIVIRH